MAVMAILAVLSASMAMALYRCKALAKKSGCAFNLRQMGIGVVSYVQDYDGGYPQTKGVLTLVPQIDDVAGAIESPDRGSPLTRLGAYSTGLTECPADLDPGATACENDPNPKMGVQSYLVNGFFVWGLNEYQIDGDSHTVYIAERRSTAVDNAPPNCDVIFRPWYTATNPQAPQNDMSERKGAIATERHMGGANYLFADDHCEWLRFNRVWNPPETDLFTP